MLRPPHLPVLTRLSAVADWAERAKRAFGYNAQSDEYGDPMEMGVIDPTEVVRTALQNAASVAALAC